MSNTIFEYFLLSATCGDSGNHFEITLWGAGTDGSRARIFADDFKPMFFCARSVPARETAAASDRKQLSLRSFDGREIDCLYFDTYAAAQQAARRLRDAGHPVFETDVNPLSRYLMERMVRAAMTVTGAAEKFGDAGKFINYKNPRVRGCSGDRGQGTGDRDKRWLALGLRVMSVGIDVGDGGEVVGIACAGEDESRLFAADDVTRSANSERRILLDAAAYIRGKDPDIIIGWGLVARTLRIIQERCGKSGVPFDIGREHGSRVTSSERERTWRDGYTSVKTVWTARIPGRVAMDVPTMLRAYHHDPDEYDINAELTPPPDCLTVAKNVLAVFNDAEILPNAVERTRRNGQTLDGVGGSVASFDYLYLPRLHRAGYVAGDVRDIAPPSRGLPGGYVLEPAPGLYENVLVFDFKSLYPSIIMTFMIDPLGFNVKDDNRQATPAGVTFSRDVSILPDIIRELMAARAQAVEQKNPYLSQAIKILMNSFYGVLGSTGCRFFSEEISSAITMTGQYILKSSIEHIEKISGQKVIYGDTDSIFVSLGDLGGDTDAATTAAEAGKMISTQTGAWLREHLKERFGADSALELKYETHYRRFFIPSIRGGGIRQGAKKHYCGAVVNKDGVMELTFKGMESARGDWTQLAREFQRELFIKFFKGEPLEEYITSVADSVTRGVYDDKLTYKKRVRKELAEYTANIPPHVQAAKLLDKTVRTIAYRVTKVGPQPVEKLTAPLDYQHYIDSQIAPIADSVLEWTGKSFDNVMSGQQDLFDTF